MSDFNATLETIVKTGVVEFEITGLRKGSNERVTVGVGSISLEEYIEEERQKLLDKYSETFDCVQANPIVVREKKKSFI